MSDIWAEYAAADRRKRAAEDEIKAAKATMEYLEPMLLEDYVTNGSEKKTYHGITYYPKRKLFVGPDADNGHTRSDVVQALEEAGLHEYVSPNYNTNSLTAYVRGVADEFGDKDKMKVNEIIGHLPEPLAKVLKVSEVMSIESRKR